jgi:hypothetical protein
MTVKNAESVDDLVPRILQQYSEKPRGWRVMSTPKGDMLVLGPESAFQLKLISINPTLVTGAGIEIPDTDKAFEKMRSTPEFGFRPISSTDIQDIIKALHTPEIARPQVDAILQRSPLPIAKIKSGESILTGPVLTRPDLKSLSPELLKTQLSLDKVAWKQFSKRYPMRAGMYG